MSALGFTDTPVLDFWWCLPWVSLIPLFWTSGDVCPGTDCFGGDVCPGFHWYPCFGLCGDVCPGFHWYPCFGLCGDVCPGFHWYPCFGLSGDVCPGFHWYPCFGLLVMSALGFTDTFWNGKSSLEISTLKPRKSENLAEKSNQNIKQMQSKQFFCSEILAGRRRIWPKCFVLDFKVFARHGIVLNNYH